MSEPEYEPVECPVADCDHRDAIRSVAAHVSGTHDPAHSWERLGYDGARDFVMDEKRRQQGGDERPRTARTSTASAAPPDATDTVPDAAEGTAEPFELGFEREALVLLELVREYDFDALTELDTTELVNLYSLLADLRSRADAARKDVRDALLETVHDDRQVAGEFGTVRRQTYTRRQIKDDDTVRMALLEAGVEPATVTSFDTKKLTQAVEEFDLDPNAVFAFEERAQIRNGDAEELHRRERFDRLPAELRSFVGDD